MMAEEDPLNIDDIASAKGEAAGAKQQTSFRNVVSFALVALAVSGVAGVAIGVDKDGTRQASEKIGAIRSGKAVITSSPRSFDSVDTTHSEKTKVFRKLAVETEEEYIEEQEEESFGMEEEEEEELTMDQEDFLINEEQEIPTDEEDDVPMEEARPAVLDTDIEYLLEDLEEFQNEEKKEPDMVFSTNSTDSHKGVEKNNPHHRALISTSDEIVIAVACEAHTQVLRLGDFGSLVCEEVTKHVLGPVLDWINGRLWNSENDDARVTISNGIANYADGDALAITWHRANGQSDEHPLGSLSKGETKTWREDLDASLLTEIELRIDDTDDVCVRNFAFTVGKEPSGTGRPEAIALPAWVVGEITGTTMRPDCIWFGDEEGSVANFKFHWPTALSCYKQYFLRPDNAYYVCMTYAMLSYDKVVNGRIRRWSFGALTPPPQLPPPRTYRQYKNRLPGNMCMDLRWGSAYNGNRVQLWPCNGSPAQQWHMDSEGRIRSKVDFNKCIEAGRAGNLYDKLFVWDCHGGLHQKWTRYSSGTIRNKSSLRFIGVAWCSNRQESQLELRNYEGGTCGTAQKWSW